MDQGGRLFLKARVAHSDVCNRPRHSFEISSFAGSLG